MDNPKELPRARKLVNTRLRAALLSFSILFCLSSVAQFLFTRNRIQKTAQSQLQAWTAEVRHELNYTTNWNLTKFRRADWSAPACYLFTTNGLLLDIEGFV